MTYILRRLISFDKSVTMLVEIHETGVKMGVSTCIYGGETIYVLNKVIMVTWITLLSYFNVMVFFFFSQGLTLSHKFPFLIWFHKLT